jgi:squalene-hopene/tetraprenyl-beta-curcumene cyclase
VRTGLYDHGVFSPSTEIPGLEAALRNARTALLRERVDAGYWEGELSPSALSTATAVFALHHASPEAHAGLIERGALWLVTHQNGDGGWGDTVDSVSNLSTTLLGWAALRSVQPGGPGEARARDWVEREVGDLGPYFIVQAVENRYGKDRTFAVPILMMCALGGLLGEDEDRAWAWVRQLPLELAAFPRAWFGALRLPVVSYALPALIAIGWVRHRKRPSPVLGRLREWVWPRISRILESIQPSGGGFLEAAPLTAFVTMALANAGEKGHPVVVRAIRFLEKGVRPDGSWAIDSNLAVWVSTLAAKALQKGAGGSDFGKGDRRRLRVWIEEQQSKKVHPFTMARPGAWAWTHFSGGVPDADDTPGALLALRALTEGGAGPETLLAAENGSEWLLDLQNEDGGIPTFCRGWGALPFDRSSPDLTAHGLRAWDAWKDEVRGPVRARMDRAMEFALRYLRETQEASGAWVPLWFGNQEVPDEANRTYGTAMVLISLNQVAPWARTHLGSMRAPAVAWLLANQNPDGGWGGGAGSSSSIEETALAVEALSGDRSRNDVELPLRRGAEFLIGATNGGTEFPARPIGFYFAKLWYSERLYPMIWTVSALQSL